jgi:Na+/H+ antiporter NhaD/arsenite permease-like protein
LYEIASIFPGFEDGGTPSVLGVTTFAALLSNLVSNVPAVMLIGDLLPSGNVMLWFALAASSTLAGNTTLIASAANVIVSERAESDGVSFNFWKFALVGIPVTIITLLISAGVIMLIF